MINNKIYHQKWVDEIGWVGTLTNRTTEQLGTNIIRVNKHQQRRKVVEGGGRRGRDGAKRIMYGGI
jgi:hypothetical protein